MALTLKTAISADQTTIDVEGTDTLREGSFRTLGDETVVIRTARVQNLQPGETAWQRLSVDRGIENSEAVAHDAGVTMATYSGGGAGGVTLDPGDGTPVPVTEIVAPGAVIVGDVATLPDGVIVLETEPTVAADGALWYAPLAELWRVLVSGVWLPELRLKVSADGSSEPGEWGRIQLKAVSTADRDATVEIQTASATGTALTDIQANAAGGPAEVANNASSTGSGTATNTVSAVTVNGASAMTAKAETTGSGYGEASLWGHATGTGDATAGVIGQTASGYAFAYLKATRDATTTGFEVEVDGSGLAALIVIGLPTADPVRAGQLWIDTAAGRVLKVSAG